MQVAFLIVFDRAEIKWKSENKNMTNWRREIAQ